MRMRTRCLYGLAATAAVLVPYCTHGDAAKDARSTATSDVRTAYPYTDARGRTHTADASYPARCTEDEVIAAQTYGDGRTVYVCRHIEEVQH